MPAPGAVWGPYPQRSPRSRTSLPEQCWRAISAWLPRPARNRLPAAAKGEIDTTLAQAARSASWQTTVAEARHALAGEAMSDAAIGRALGVAGSAMQRTQGLAPYDTQYFAAWLILRNQLAEMATGEGKTVAASLAAGVAGMASIPVHVLTANDYLVQRDATRLQPYYEALGLKVGYVTASTAAAQRRAAYACDVTYATAKEVAFDYLRDHMTLGGERDPRLLRLRELADSPLAAPVLRGLCMAVVDEADSLLLDEACVPLILAGPGGEVDDAAFRLAFGIATSLWRNRDFTLDAPLRRARLTARGCDAVDEALRGTGRTLAPARRAYELVETALAARHHYRRDREYALTERGVELIDETTGRIANGRQWSGGLHQMIEIKEGREPSPLTVTVAQISFQRFFPRYLRLGGMSGTLREAARELHWLYGTPVTRVPLAKPGRRIDHGTSVYVSNEARCMAIVERVQQLHRRGRPVLVGTESVAATTLLSARLQAAGLAHQVLNALQDADEAERVARAAERGAITVATNIAGRGTDIRLAPGIDALGGLHVIACLRNRSRRIDRQLIGRCARHGDPGSAEVMLALDDALFAAFAARWMRALLQAVSRRGAVPTPLALPLFALAQRIAEWNDFFVRRQLRRSDVQARATFAFAGGLE